MCDKRIIACSLICSMHVCMSSFSVGTMGVCLSPCSLPGGGPLFQLGPNDMELGMGNLVIILIYLVY